MYVRGNAMDFDRWDAQEHAPGWSYADVLPYFKRMESYVPGDDTPKDELQRYRGFDGPLGITNSQQLNKHHSKTPICSTFVEATIQAGYGYTHDNNGYKQEGACWYDSSVRNGERSSADVAYLSRALATNRVVVRTYAHATKLVYNSNKSRVVGVQVADLRNRKAVDTVYASKDVIVSGGVVNSPQLLMLSGIGDPEWLKQHGIDTVVNLPGVGRNLQDHLCKFDAN
jgi:choline dehydrogenase-like flavoprotein